MKVLIIEDEQPAARRLASLVEGLPDPMEVVEVLDSVAGGVDWLNKNPSPDLVFMDIQLSDDLSFAIFEQVKIESPIIFTTAFDEYALRAFEVNSIDYLLKPIEADKLQRSIEKLSTLRKGSVELAPDLIQSLVQSVTKGAGSFKKRFLVKKGEQLQTVDIDEVAYFITENKVNFLVSTKGKKFMIDYTLDVLETQLDPAQFFRLNRQCIAGINTIGNIQNYFNGKLKVDLSKGIAIDPQTVSREKASAFKQWLDQ